MGLDWINLARDREQRQTPVNAVMNLWVPQSVGKFLSSRPTVGSSRRTRLHGFS
jgi:hypothetical protein